MLYLFYGSDRNKALKNALNIIEKKVAEKPDANIFKIDKSNLSKEILEEMCGSQSLFEKKYIVHIKDVFDEDESMRIISPFLKDLKESENIFILTEGDLNKKEITLIEKFADKVWSYEMKKVAEQKVNVFGITDYVLNRDKKNLWINYQKLKNDVPVAEIHGIVFWAFKNIMIAANAKTAKESGLKDFVFNKSKKASAKFSKEELDEKLWQLVSMLGDSRRGEGELDVLFEKWVLEI